MRFAEARELVDKLKDKYRSKVRQKEQEIRQSPHPTVKRRLEAELEILKIEEQQRENLRRAREIIDNTRRTD